MLFRNSFPLPPLTDNGLPGNRTAQRLAGTGTAETQTHRRLIHGKVHLLLVGAAGVRVRFSGNIALGAGAVDPTRDVVYGPWSQIPFVPQTDESTFMYAEAADATAAYECFVVQYQS